MQLSCPRPANGVFLGQIENGFFSLVPYRCHGMSNYGGLRFKLISKPGKYSEVSVSTAVTLRKLCQPSEPFYISQAKCLEDGSAFCVESP